MTSRSRGVRIPPVADSELRTPDGIKVRLHVFPTSARLAADVDRVWRELVQDRVDSATFRVDLERRLRAWYPMATVAVQDDFAALAQDDEVWYVFRDGRVARPNGRRDALYDALADARVTERATAAAIRRAELTMAAAHAPRRRPRPASPGTTA